MAEYPKDLLEDSHRLSELVVKLIDKFKDSIVIHVIDPQSLPGIYKSLRYRVRSYPTFIVNGQKVLSGWNRAVLERALESQKTDQ